MLIKLKLKNLKMSCQPLLVHFMNFIETVNLILTVCLTSQYLRGSQEKFVFSNTLAKLPTKTTINAAVLS